MTFSLRKLIGRRAVTLRAGRGWVGAICVFGGRLENTPGMPGSSDRVHPLREGARCGCQLLAVRAFLTQFAPFTYNPFFRKFVCTEWETPYVKGACSGPYWVAGAPSPRLWGRRAGETPALPMRGSSFTAAALRFGSLRSLVSLERL